MSTETNQAVDWTDIVDDGVRICTATINGYGVRVDDHEHVHVELYGRSDVFPTKVALTKVGMCDMSTGKRVAQALALALPHGGQ